MFFGNARWAACPQHYRGKEVNTRASPTFCLGFYSPRLRRMREFIRILLFLGVSGHQTRVEYRYAICEAGGIDWIWVSRWGSGRESSQPGGKVLDRRSERVLNFKASPHMLRCPFPYRPPYSSCGVVVYLNRNRGKGGLEQAGNYPQPVGYSSKRRLRWRRAK